ncbi:MAG TPA: GTP-binding protein [Planctomycetes bacterium]|nr:GTP-binding protein [Planctomycetota bacterium]
MQPRLEIDDTIAAIASTRGGLRGIVRLSGPAVAKCLLDCTDVGDDVTQEQGARRTCGHVSAGPRFGRLPCDVYFWPGGKSYTKQPSAEIHMQGSSPLLAAVLEHVCRSGARLAGPGEFTLRAFLAGRLDLTQAEAVLGVIDADTQGELDLALQQLAGGLAGPLQQIRETLLNLLADLEAGLDFVEEDIQFVSIDTLVEEIDRCLSIADQLVEQIRQRTDRRSVVRAVFVGPGNAGKSSLFNRLSESQEAIVADLAGTTRDYVTITVQWDEVAVELVDTAGIVSSTDGIAAEASARRESAVANADIRIVCRPADGLAEQHQSSETDVPAIGRGTIHVITKCDRRPDRLPIPGQQGSIITSSKTGQGVDELRAEILSMAGKQVRAPIMAGTAVRCAESLHQTGTALRHAREACQDQLGEEIVAVELREALHGLATIVGAVYTDDILDRLFSRFCIGK